MENPGRKHKRFVTNYLNLSQYGKEVNESNQKLENLKLTLVMIEIKMY